MGAVPHRFIVRGYGGHTEVDGWRLGDWAAHQQLADPSQWCITHLPTGLSLPLIWASFKTRGAAIGAMQEIVTLKNSWAFITQKEMTRELGEKLRAICLRYGAQEGPVQIKRDLEESDVGLPSVKRYNGYEDVTWPE